MSGLLRHVRDRATITVDEAADLMGISRGNAYDAARRYLETAGAEGLPVLRFGRRLVVPVAKLLTLLGHPEEQP